MTEQKAITDTDRLDWLCQCTAGEWEQLGDMRLTQPVGALRQAIDTLMLAEHQQLSEHRI